MSKASVLIGSSLHNWHQTIVSNSNATQVSTRFVIAHETDMKLFHTRKPGKTKPWRVLLFHTTQPILNKTQNKTPSAGRTIGLHSDGLCASINRRNMCPLLSFPRRQGKTSAHIHTIWHQHLPHRRRRRQRSQTTTSVKPRATIMHTLYTFVCVCVLVCVFGAFSIPLCMRCRAVSAATNNATLVRSHVSWFEIVPLSLGVIKNFCVPPLRGSVFFFLFSSVHPENDDDDDNDYMIWCINVWQHTECCVYGSLDPAHVMYSN